MKLKYTQYYPQLIEDLVHLIQIDTCYDASSISLDCPYGKKVKEGMQYFCEIATRDGFVIEQYDNQAVSISYGNGLKRIDVVSHMDVVEPGEGWHDNPFSGKIVDGYLYGRGTQDMKSTLLLTYYALKIIKDYNIPLNKKLQVVIGSDEERTMEDIKKYIELAGQPEFAFTPDGQFPYSLGEKGALMWTIQGKVKTKIVSFHAGIGCNVVADKAEVTLQTTLSKDEMIAYALGFGIEVEVIAIDNGLQFTVTGKTAHASMPYLGRSAIVDALRLCSLTEDLLSMQLYHAFKDYLGSGMNINYSIEPMGPLTINLGILNIEEEMVFGLVDSRYPYGTSSEHLTKLVKKELSLLSVSLDYDAIPVLNDKDNPYLKTLMSLYQTHTQDTLTDPIISGGVTYSKVISNCVAFGPKMPSDELLAHQANERIPLEKLKLLLPLYTEAMIALANLKE